MTSRFEALGLLRFRWVRRLLSVSDLDEARPAEIPRLIAAEADFGTQLVKELEAGHYLNPGRADPPEKAAVAAAERAEILKTTVGHFPRKERERIAGVAARQRFLREDAEAREFLEAMGYTDPEDLEERLARAADRCEAALDEADPEWADPDREWRWREEYQSDDFGEPTSANVLAQGVPNVGDRAGHVCVLSGAWLERTGHRECAICGRKMAVSRGTQEETTMDSERAGAGGRLNRAMGGAAGAPTAPPTVASELNRLLTHTMHAEQVATVLDEVVREVFGCNIPRGEGPDAVSPDPPMVVRLERMNERLEAAIKLIDSAAQILRDQLVTEPRPR